MIILNGDGMKMCFLFLLFITVSPALNAQTFDEWFRQKKTQREYLLKQIVLLQQYMGYAKKGYDIAQKGLTTISQIKNGDFSLHSFFFQALKQVNPLISEYPKAEALLSSFTWSEATCRNTIRKVNSSGFLSAGDVEYALAVLENVRTENEESINVFLLVITPDKLQLSDDERLKKLDDLYVEVLDRQAFIGSFCDEIGLLEKQRRSDIQDIEVQKVLYGLK
ncbi:hypothetical protein [Chitinophaga defluvii]|uniref:TerB family tellurite resistance protein n=1 Tax=Chitinophaga defluvii TaxID=3163343 RepID=A0ABV2T4B7_9BACT